MKVIHWFLNLLSINNILNITLSLTYMLGRFYDLCQFHPISFEKFKDFSESTYSFTIGLTFYNK